VPIPIRNYWPSGQIPRNSGIADDLQAMLDSTYLGSRSPPDLSHEQQQLSDTDLTSHQEISWLASWPQEGVNISTTFKYLQHDGMLRDCERSKQSTMRAFSDIPHLEITVEGGPDATVLVWLANNIQYRVTGLEPENISSMERGQYTLRAVDGPSIRSHLEIDDTILNEPFIEATRHLNGLLVGLKSYFDGIVRRKSVFSFIKSHVSLTRLNEPNEATRAWADIVSLSGERLCCAVAFKIDNRIVYREDILREMNDSCSYLRRAVERVEIDLSRCSRKRATDEATRSQQNQVTKLTETLNKVKRFIEDGIAKLSEVRSLHQDYPDDPITRVIYPSFVRNSGDRLEWQGYQTQLKKDRNHLLVWCKKLTVDTLAPVEDNVLDLTLIGSTLTLSVEPLTSESHSDALSTVSPGSHVLWIGYYIVVVEELNLPEHCVFGWCRVLSQRQDAELPGKKHGVQQVRYKVYVLV
jgi:hypothetical protein